MKENRYNWLFAAGRLIGFVTLAAPAILILAGLVLLPAYARWQHAEYEKECLATACRESAAMITAQQRLIEDLPDNEVLTKRLAMAQGELSPENEHVSSTGDRPLRPPPDVIPPIHYPRPAPPNDVLMRASVRLANPATRRGLLLLACGCMLTAMFLFAPPDRRRDDGDDIATA